jgi:hypothetical protein
MVRPILPLCGTNRAKLMHFADGIIAQFVKNLAE